jgi:hypothetical protein
MVCANLNLSNNKSTPKSLWIAHNSLEWIPYIVYLLSVPVTHEPGVHVEDVKEDGTDA